MSEKRFVLAYKKGNEAIFEDRDYPYPKRMTNKEVEKKLNELNDENEQLRQRYYALKKENDRLENNIIHLNESNDCKEKNLKIMELSDTEHNLKMLLANSDEQTEIFIKGLQDENEQLKSLLKDAEEEIETLKKSNQCSMEALANKISKRVAEEPEVKECSFCGEFRTEYHEEDCCGNWSAEDFCNAGHDLEDTDPNSCKDYWDNF